MSESMPSGIPPIKELVLGVQFTTEKPVDTTKIVGFWHQRLAQDYPHVAEAQPIEDVFEKFGDHAVSPPKLMQIRFNSTPKLRYLFSNITLGRMVQIQPSRLIVNWREGESVYPRFSVVSAEFLRRVLEWQNYGTAEGLGEVVPNQWELCYVNFIPQGGLMAVACRLASHLAIVCFTVDRF
jgi:uncharacterized protein (TIGR04255 family)